MKDVRCIESLGGKGKLRIRMYDFMTGVRLYDT
jgi:hypothetical protein